MSEPSSAIIVPTILVDGSALADTLAVLSIDVLKEVNRVPRARLVVVAQGEVLAQADLLRGDPFAIGAEVEIKLRPADTDVSVFKGVVSGIGIRMGAGAPVLSIELRDKAIKLTQKRQARLFTEATDADVISTILQDAGLQTGDVPSTEPTHPALVQSYATDWDFIVSRAEAMGFVVVVDDGVVSLKPMAIAGAAAASLTPSAGGYEAIEFEFDTTHQHPGMVGIAWNADDLTAADPSQADVLDVPQGGLGTTAVGGEVGFDTYVLTHLVPMPQPEVQAWANARMARSRLALIRGRLSASFLIEVKPMQVVSLEDLGERFNGSALVTGVRYRFDASGFRTDLQFGLSPEPFSREPDIIDVAAAGLLPAATGLQLGVVTDIEDPESAMRVKVRIPAVSADSDLWARVTAPDAGNERGIVFRPEVDDEVVVAFLGNDPRYPIVIGRLHGTKNVPPEDFADHSADNIAKGIVTRSGLKLAFADAEKPSITITTPAGNQLLLDDDGKTVTLTDENGNTIALNDEGISVTTGKDFKIEADGKVTIKGQEVGIN